MSPLVRLMIEHSCVGQEPRRGYKSVGVRQSVFALMCIIISECEKIVVCPQHEKTFFHIVSKRQIWGVRVKKTLVWATVFSVFLTIQIKK